MNPAKADTPIGKTGAAILVGLLVYCVILWIPAVARVEILDISLNIWGGLGLLLIAPMTGLVYAVRQPRDEE